MFRATMCRLSGEPTVFMRHLVLVIVCEWLESYAPAHQSSTQDNKYQVSHKHSWFSWWSAHSRPKHVEFVKYSKINCAPSWLYLEGYTEMYGQQNMWNVQYCTFLWFLYAPSFENSIRIKLIFLITLIVSNCCVITVTKIRRNGSGTGIKTLEHFQMW